MRRLRQLTISGRVLLVAAILLVGMAAVAGAAGSGIITSCVNKSTGALRIIGAGGTCKATEVKLAWNVQGPPGPQGPAGPQGPPGPTLSAFCPYCNLGAVNADGINLTGAFLNYATGDPSFVSANLTNAHMIEVQFASAHFANATLTGANLTAAALAEVDFTGANLQNASLESVDLTNATMTNADLSGAHGTPSTITGTIWRNTTCPDGTNSDNDGGTCQGHFLP